jgi:hypothetical protein
VTAVVLFSKEAEASQRSWMSHSSLNASELVFDGVKLQWLFSLAQRLLLLEET